MPWKLDESRKIVTDANGNPVFVTETGEDKAVDYPGLLKRLSEVNVESGTRKQKIRALEEKLALFDGIEDLKAWKDEELGSRIFMRKMLQKAVAGWAGFYDVAGNELKFSPAMLGEICGCDPEFADLLALRIRNVARFDELEERKKLMTWAALRLAANPPARHAGV